MVFWFRGQIWIAVLWSEFMHFNRTGGSCQNNKVILLDAGDKYSVPSKTRVLFQVRKWAGVLRLAGSVLASPAGKWCCTWVFLQITCLVKVSLLSWRWKGVVECICLLLYNDLKLGYLTNINKSNHGLKIYFFLVTLLYCTSVVWIFFVENTDRIKSYWLKPGVLY